MPRHRHHPGTAIECAAAGFGLQDTALNSDGLNNTWDWNDADTTIVTAPQASHFVQQDAAELVTTTLRWWLLSRP